MGLLARLRRRRTVTADGDDTRERSARGGNRRASTGAALGRARSLLSQLILAVAGVIAAIIVVAIVLVLLKANPDNAIVDAFRETGRFFAQPFDTMFELEKRRTEIAVNWGIAAAVYLTVGVVIARIVAR